MQCQIYPNENSNILFLKEKMIAMINYYKKEGKPVLAVDCTISYIAMKVYTFPFLVGRS